MDHDLRYDSDKTQHNLPAVDAASKPDTGPDCTVWTQAVDRRLRVLESTVNRLADVVQVLILRLDDGK